MNNEEIAKVSYERVENFNNLLKKIPEIALLKYNITFQGYF